MKTFNRYLIFFVIVAVGLVVSWGQIGKRTGQAMDNLQAELLTTEDECRPLVAPCAAYGLQQALVLGPHAVGFMLKYQSASDASAEVSANYLTKKNAVTQETVLIKHISKNTWTIARPSAQHPAYRLRIYVETPDTKGMTEFDI